jgi:PAS domain S-box-containing protein
MRAQEQQPPTLRKLQASLATIEANLARSRRQLAEAQQLARIGSWEWDITANEVWWSDELYRIYGLEPQSLKPTYENFLGYVHPDDRPSVDERNRRAFADHRPFEDVKRVVRADGTEINMRTQGEVICDEAGNPVRMVGICEDVTGRAQSHAPAEAAHLRDRALQINDDVVGPLGEAAAQLARGEIGAASATIDEARRNARRIAGELLGDATSAPASS